jgi:hypothetical protein
VEAQIMSTPPPRARIDWQRVCANGLTRHDWLVQMRDNRKTVHEIAVAVRVNAPAVGRYLRKIGAPKLPPCHRLPEGVQGAIAEMWGDHTITVEQIGARLGLTKCSVIGIARRMGLRRVPIETTPEQKAAGRRPADVRANDKKRAKRQAAGKKSRAKRVRKVQPIAVPAQRWDAPTQRQAAMPAIEMDYQAVAHLAIAAGQRDVPTKGFDLAALNAKRVAAGEAPLRIRKRTFAVPSGAYVHANRDNDRLYPREERA